METGNFFHELDSMFKAGNIKGAEQYLISAMGRAVEEKDLPALLAIANELGGIFRVTDRLEEAKKVYGTAVELIGLLGLENTEQHGTTLLNLGSVHTESNDPSGALGLYDKAEMIFRRAGLDRDYRMAALYNNMSHACDKLGEPEKALACAEKALAVIRNLEGYDTELATTHTTLASRYSKMLKYDEAWKHLKEAEKIFLSQPGKPNVHYAATLNSLGEICHRKGRSGEAADFFEGALEIIRESYGENQSYREVSANLAKVRAEMTSSAKVNADTVPPAAVNGAAVSAPKWMTGLELSEAYYNEYGRKMIEEGFSEYKRYMAVGLAGEGSECFGFDDELSESHDYGPGFCIWLPDEIYKSVGWKMKEAYERLPKTYLGRRRMETAEGMGRVGVFSTREFYRKYTGCDGIPENQIEWLFAPETSLATAVNGKVFEDHLGEFTRIRDGLLGFYPRDIRLKKLAARMALMSQAGQYNYERCMKREEYAAAYLSCGEFIHAAVSIVYLLNDKYMPFYKWMFRGMGRLTRLNGVKTMLEQLAAAPDLAGNSEKKVSLIEDVCVMVRDELELQGIVKGKDPFLNSHCRDVMSLITDPQIRNLPVMFDGK